MTVRVEFLLLSFAVGVSAMEKFHNSSSGRFESTTTTTVTLNYNQTTTTQSNFQLDKTPQNKEGLNRENVTGTPQQGAGNKTIPEILRKTHNCRERYKTIAVRGRGGVKSSNVSVFHCNMSKELVGELRNEVGQLEVFKGIIVLYPKSRASSLNLGARKQVQNLRKSFFPKEKNIRRGRKGRDTLLKSDQMESNTKVAQISHIYLGRSLYPFLTEESRIIDKDHTLPPPVYPGPTYTDND